MKAYFKSDKVYSLQSIDNIMPWMWQQYLSFLIIVICFFRDFNRAILTEYRIKYYAEPLPKDFVCEHTDILHGHSPIRCVRGDETAEVLVIGE